MEFIGSGGTTGTGGANGGTTGTGLEQGGHDAGAVLEASILVEAGGGTGSVAFPTANVTAQ